MQRKRRRGRSADRSESVDQQDEDIPIDIIENMRDRSPRDHVRDEVIGKEMQKRCFYRCIMQIVNNFKNSCF